MSRRNRVVPALKAAVLVAVCVFGLAIVASGGCSSSSTPSVGSSPTPTPSLTPGPSPSPTPSPTPTPTAVNFVILAYASIPPTADPTYGELDGFATAAANPIASSSPSPSPTPTFASQVVTVHCNQTIQFFNLDLGLFHTASLLGPTAGANWPPWNNTNGANTASKQFIGSQLTPITYPNFSTGTLTTFRTGGSASLVYSTGASAGTFYFGDYFQYPSMPPMRTVINILCP